FLNDDLGPVWYRGYYMHRKFNESQLDTILSYFDKNHIIIGHTPNMRIRSFFNNKILGVDTGIMYKRQGEMLIYKNGDFYRGRISGKRIKL
ncbi:MAG: hypothetical protein JXN62_04660, partial [Bacteroidales bacterium]|nr:hypothetical protein [Bacteroidales bacterium]